MTRYFLLFFLSIIFSSLHAQNAGISYGIQVAPGFSFRKSLPLNDTSIDDLIALDELESGEFAYSAGIRVEFNWGEKAGFQTGANFIQMGYHTELERSVVQIEGTETIVDREQRFDFKNIEIPFILNFYQEMSPQGRIYFKMGGSAIYGISRKARTIEYVEEEVTSDNTTSIIDGADANISIQTGMGYEHTFAGRFALFVEPNFQYYLRSQHSDFKFGRQPYFLGVTIGMKL